MPLKYFTLLALICLLALGCAKEAEETAPSAIQKFSIDTLEVFTSFEDHNIAQPSTLKFVENQGLYIADFGQKTITLVDSKGELVNTFGREGRGPGEFLGIANMFNTGDMLHVIDINQSVISKFNLNGNFLSSLTFKSAAILKEVAAINQNKYAIASGGAENALLSVTDFNTDSTFYFGKPKGDSMEFVDLQTSLNQLKSGEIPTLFKNMVTLRSDGVHIYAYLNAYSEFHKYDTSGNLIWEQKLDLPYNEDIFNRTVEQAKSSPGGLPAYNYILDFEIIARETIILTNRKTVDDPQLLVRISESGTITHIVTLPENIGFLNAFDINTSDNIIYFASFQNGFVYRADFPL